MLPANGKNRKNDPESANESGLSSECSQSFLIATSVHNLLDTCTPTETATNTPNL